MKKEIVHNVMLHSELTRSTAVGVNAACPHEDLAPLMDMIDDRRREKDSRHLSQHIVLL